MKSLTREWAQSSDSDPGQSTRGRYTPAAAISSMITEEEPENMILVIRMTSSGKSHFIDMLAPWNEIREGHKLGSGQILKRTNG